MNLISWGTNVLEDTSPVGLVLIGGALALTASPIRRGIHAAMVMTARAALAVSDFAVETGSRMKEEMEDIVAEAKENQTEACENMRMKLTDLGEKAKAHSRKAAVGATAGMLAVADKAKSGIKDIVEEAQATRKNLEASLQDDETPIVDDGLEVPDPDASESSGPRSPRRRR